MIAIPGFLISIITFPGVIVHELAHAIFCKIFRVPIYEIKYFQMDNTLGYVAHERPNNSLKTLLILVGPFIINTILGLLITRPIAVSTIIFKDEWTYLNYFLAWIGVSLLMHAFPSIGDAKVLIDTIIKNKEVSIIFKIITCPIVGLIYLGSLGSSLWLDFIYAGFVAVVVNLMIMKLSI